MPFTLAQGSLDTEIYTSGNTLSLHDALPILNNDFAGIKNWFNEFYARDTSRKIRAVQKAKGERGCRNFCYKEKQVCLCGKIPIKWRKS